ncbi:Transcription initiation factor TFIID subunit 12 [Blattella germanica]|nr:Transcription initiation factor TFIID subunit 12 [Blattella germanica]
MATNLGGNIGQPQNVVTTIGNVIPSTGSLVTMPGQQLQVPNAQQQTMGTSIETAMDVDVGMQSSMVSSQVNLPNVSSSPAPGLGNLQSVVGSGIGNAITTSSIVTMSSHSPLSSALQGGNTNSLPPTQTSANALGPAQVKNLVREVDPTEQLDEEVEELLLQLADDFVESTVGAACLLAKHRKASTVEVKDVQLHLERNWNMWIPGFGTDELRPYKRATVTEAHKQRLALIRKALKKY